MNINPEFSEGQQEGSLSSLDINKLLLVIRKSAIWLIFIFLSCNFLAYLYIRYTKPLYESVSELKLDIKSEATTLGLPSYENENFNNLSGEIQLIKSKLFFGKLIQILDLEVSYYAYGKILNEERYKSSPFKIEYFLKEESFYDKPIDVEIIDKAHYRLSYNYKNNSFDKVLRFDQTFENDHLKIKGSLNGGFEPSLKNSRFYFVVNSNKALVNYIDKNITVEPINLNANTIKVAFKDFNKIKAKDIVEAIDNLYFQHSKEEKNKANKQKIDFLNQQLFLTEKKLEEFENYFESFTIDNKTLNLQSEITDIIKIMVELDSQRYEVQNKIHKANNLKKQLKEDASPYLITAEETLLPQELLKSITELNQLFSEKNILLSSYNQNTFAVSKKSQQIDLLKTSVLKTFDDYLGKLFNEQKKLDKRKAEIENNFVSLPSKGTEFNKAKRFHALYEGFYLSLMQKKNEFEIAEAGTVTNFILLSPATLPTSPLFPNTTLVYVVGIMGGLVFGLLFIAVSYLLHDKISNQQDLEHLTESPILGELPLYKSEKLVHSKLVIHKNPKSILSESLRTVRTNLDFINSAKGKKVITITSTLSGEGKTFVAVNLSGLMAMSYMKVVIVDLDMRKPKVHYAFGEDMNGQGVSTILIKKHTLAQCIRNSPLENLDYLPAGPIPPNPSELILSKRFKELLSELKEIYDIIIIDTPPVGLVTDGLLAMKESDIQIYIARADYTKKEAIKTVNRIFRNNKFNNFAIILNGVSKGGNYGYYQNNYGYFEEGEKSSYLKKLLTRSKYK